MKTIKQQHMKHQILAMSVGMTLLCYLSLILVATIPEVRAQPAEFSAETGLLEIPVIKVNDQRLITEAELQLQDTNTLMFQLVDYAFDTEPEIQQLALNFNESVTLSETSSLRFIDVLAESRCPLDVVCITAGEVTVILRVTEIREDSNTDRTDFGLTLGGLDISEHYFKDSYYRLAEANPYPVSTEEVVDEDYSIIVEISPQPFPDK